MPRCAFFWKKLLGHHFNISSNTQSASQLRSIRIRKECPLWCWTRRGSLDQSCYGRIWIFIHLLGKKRCAAHISSTITTTHHTHNPHTLTRSPFFIRSSLANPKPPSAPPSTTTTNQRPCDHTLNP